jgi:hypothetical protein
MPTSHSQQFGDLLLQFTTDFHLTYNDKGSGSKRDASFWTPQPSNGFSILGSFGQSGYTDPNGTQWALCVAEAKPGSGALKSPVDWVEIWNDHGSGGKNDGSCWRPVPPQNYNALGDLFVKGYAKPPLNAVVCVRKDLTFPGKIGTSIWNDLGSGVHTDIGVWSIDVLPGPPDQYGFIATNTFVAVNGYDTPITDPAANVLLLRFPSKSAAEPELPQLDSVAKPAEQTTPVVDHTVLVPFTAIKDELRTLAWQIQNSPFYTIERYVYYSLILFNRNLTQQQQSTSSEVTVGVTNTQTSQFSTTTGITVGYSSGVDLGLFSAKVNASVSIELGYMQSSSVAVMKSSTVRANLDTPAQHAAALWTASYRLNLIRADGERVGLPLAFEAAGSSFLESQFPPPEGAARVSARAVFAG